MGKILIFAVVIFMLASISHCQTESLGHHHDNEDDGEKSHVLFGLNPLAHCPIAPIGTDLYKICKQMGHRKHDNEDGGDTSHDLVGRKPSHLRRRRQL